MYDFIKVDPRVLSGKPHIKGTRLSVEFILELFGSGADRAEILSAYPQLASHALDETMQYAANAMRNEVILTAEVAV